jgi:hypothetical protein
VKRNAPERKREVGNGGCAGTGVLTRWISFLFWEKLVIWSSGGRAESIKNGDLGNETRLLKKVVKGNG